MNPRRPIETSSTYRPSRHRLRRHDGRPFPHPLRAGSARRLVVLPGLLILLSSAAPLATADPPRAGGTDSVVLRVNLIGDAGYAGPSNDAPIRAIGDAAARFDAPELTVFLGDNIYGSGMPPPGDKDRGRAERILDAQLALFYRDTAMEGVFLPGNHDWGGMGSDGYERLLRQSEYLRAEGPPRVRMLPDRGEPGPALVSRTDVVQVIALDSQWWLHGHARPGYPGSPSDSATMEAIADSLARLLAEFDGAVSIVLAHHPLETHGPHGGYFPVMDHIFPLRNIASWMWIPLPVIGSAYPIIRASGYSEQDVTSDEYGRYIEAIGGVAAGAAEEGGRTVIVSSGHEHSLQVIRPGENLWYLVSGNGILDHSTPVSDGPSTLFASRTAGYMTLDVRTDGSVELAVIGVKEKGSAPAVLYTHTIPAPGGD